MKNITKLATMLGMAGINGSVSLAALQGLFTLKNAPMLAILFMAGPGAILTACLLDGATKERILAALVAGALATIIVIFAAGIGPKLLNFVNLNIIKIFGGIAIFFIALMIAGIKIPEKIPFIILVAGIIGGIIWK